MNMWFGHGFWLAEILAILLGVVFWGGLIVLIVLGIRWFLRQDRAGSQGNGAAAPGGAPGPENPLEILRRRYAAGEIDDEEYERRRKVLKG